VGAIEYSDRDKSLTCESAGHSRRLREHSWIECSARLAVPGCTQTAACSYRPKMGAYRPVLGLKYSMRPIRLKISDLADATGYTRYQIRGLLQEVFAAHPLGKKAGAQRTFSPQDLGVVAVICAIERDYAVDRRRLALAADAIRRVLSGPRTANRGARLLLGFTPPNAAYLDRETLPDAEGLLIRLGPIFAKVDEYLGVSGSSPENAQPILPLRPSIATGRRGVARNR